MLWYDSATPLTPAMPLTRSARSPLVIAATLACQAYFAIDRHKLAYLHGIEKVNCTFFSYANGLIAYLHEAAARTEQYLCMVSDQARARDFDTTSAIPRLS